LRYNKNLFIAKRGNYGWNSMGLLDYLCTLRIIQKNQLPKYVLFMQEHYLVPEFYENGDQKSDTLARDKSVDLNEVEHIFQEDDEIGAIFSVCNGTQVAENMVPSPPGSCYFSRPEIYKRYYNFNHFPKPSMQPYHYAGWVERELGRIIHSYNYYFYDMNYKLKFRETHELPYKPIETLGLENSKQRSKLRSIKNLIIGNRVRPLRFKKK